MTTRSPFARGCVVSRGGQFGVVWADRGLSLDLLTVLQPEHRHLNDVLLELGDLIAMAAPIAHAVIRPTVRTVRAEGQEPVGTVPGAVMCRVVVSMVREAANAAIAERWAGDRGHRREAKTRPVNLVSA